MDNLTIKDCIDLYNENLYDQDYDLIEYIKFIDECIYNSYGEDE
jgi:hypothetical protein